LAISGSEENHDSEGEKSSVEFQANDPKYSGVDDDGKPVQPMVLFQESC
jgi:hypothetical protein